MKKQLIKLSSLLIPFHTFLVFLAGFLLALTIMFKIDADYTEELFDQLGKHILKEAQANRDTREQTVLRAKPAPSNFICANTLSAFTRCGFMCF